MVLLVLAAVGLAFVLNALRPVRLTPLVVPAFFAAWLTVELAPQLIALTLVGVVIALLLGGFSTPAWIGLGLAVAAFVGLVRLVLEAERAEQLAEQALVEWADIGEAPVHQRSAVRRFFVPMAFTDKQVLRTPDIAYGEEHKRNRLDVYQRVDKPTGAPVLVQVHGGGWVIGDKKQQGRPLMLEMARRGWVCFAPNYRLSPRATFPDHLVDVKRTLAWVKEHAHLYGGDPGFVVLTGGSAGGHLVALAALTANDPEYQPGFEDADTSVQGCVPYYGVYDLEGETGTKEHRFRHERLMTRLVMKTRDAEAFRKASPLARTHAEAPAFLVIHGRNDTLVPVAEARLLVERLRAVSSQPVLYLELPGTQHAFDVFPSVRSAHVVRAVARFLESLHARHAAGLPGPTAPGPDR